MLSQVSSSLDPVTSKVNAKNNFLNTRMAQQVSVPSANAQHARSIRTQTSSTQTTTRSDAYLSQGLQGHLLLLLLPLPLPLLLPRIGPRTSQKIQRSQLSSRAVRALTLSLSLSPLSAPRQPPPQDILHLSSHPRLRCNSAVLWFGGHGSVHM